MNPDGSINCSLPHNPPCQKAHSDDYDRARDVVGTLLTLFLVFLASTIVLIVALVMKPQHITTVVQHVDKTITKTNTVTKTVPAVFKFTPGESVYVNDSGWTAGHIQAVTNNGTYVVKEANGDLSSFSAGDIATTVKP